MTDRELLELAAKAAGFSPADLDDRYDTWESAPILIHRGWNPLTDDGDALRLAVKLSMMIARRININGEFVIAEVPNHMFEAEYVNTDWNAATRRAIVRAAAEIGRAMP